MEALRSSLRALAATALLLGASAIPTRAQTTPVTPAATELHIFVGPKDRELLAEVGRELHNPSLGDVIDYGFFGVIVRPLIYPLAWALNFFAGIFRNYGWAIVVVTIMINLAMWPLRASSSKKMKQAAKHQPRLKELQERMKKLKENPKKYERELQQLQQEQMAIMKEANPLGGCLPLLLQLPIFWAVALWWPWNWAPVCCVPSVPIRMGTPMKPTW